MSKTKRTHGVDLNARCFAYIGDPEDTNSWKFCIHVPGDEAKTVNSIRMSLSRFDTTKIPDSERMTVWFTVYGAARSHGVPVERREFNKPTVEVLKAEAKAIELSEADTVLSDRELAVLMRQTGGQTHCSGDLAMSDQTFVCYACKEQNPVSQQIECCGCEQAICYACNDRNACACDLMKLKPATTLVN